MWRDVAVVASLLSGFVRGSEAAAAGASYSLLTDPGLVAHTSGADALVGTADDVLRWLPGPDGEIGTADDVPANARGAASALQFSGLPFGGDFESFAAGSIVISSFSVAAQTISAAVFDIDATADQTTSIAATLADLDDAPHVIAFDFDGGAALSARLSLCIGGATNCLTLRSSFAGAAIRNAVGSDDPFAVPGIDPVLAAAMQGWKALLPAGWTQLVALQWPATTMTSLDTEGTIAPFFLGGRVSGVLVLVGIDSGLADTDGDRVFDAADACPFAADPAQLDRGGIGSGSSPDGIGDECQCGDVNGDGRVTTADAVVLQRALLVPPAASLAQPALCDIGGSASCTAADAVILRRALLTPPTATIQSHCAPAVP